MKKETKRIIVAGIAMMLGCATYGNVVAAEVQTKLSYVPDPVLVVDSNPTITKVSAIYGIDATSGNADGNAAYPTGKIDSVDVGIYAGNDSSSEHHQASYTLQNIDINANRQEYNNQTIHSQNGAYARKNGDIILGTDDTESVSISATNLFAYLKSASKETKKNEITGEWEPTGKYTLLYQAGAANGLYTNTTARYGAATITVKGKQIAVNATALGEAYGIRASVNSTIDVGNETSKTVSITANGSTAKAIENKANTAIKGGKIEIDAKGRFASYGVYTNSQSTTTIGTDRTEELTIKANGTTTVNGINTQKNNGNATFKGKKFQLEATSSNDAVTGILSNSKTSILSDNAIVNISGKKAAYGIYFSTKASLVDIQAKNQLTMSVDADDSSATAILGVDGKASVSADVLNISAKGKTAQIVVAQKESSIELGKNASEVNLNVKGTEGAAAISSADESTIKVGESAGKVNISSTAGSIARGINIANGTSVVVGGTNSDVVIKTQAGGESIGIFAMQDTSNTTGGPKAVINGKSLTIEADSDSNDSIGIHVQNGSTTATDDKATVNVNTENTDITAKTALSVFSQGVLNVNSNLVTHGENAIMTRGDSDVNINTDGKHTTKLNGDIVFDYGGTTSVDSNVNVNLTGADSSWTGNAKVNWESSDPSTAPSEEQKQVNNMNLTVADGAQWNPTSVEEKATDTNGTMATAINSLNLNKGVVNLDDKNLSEDFVVNVDKISGNGTINTNNLQNVMAVQDKTDGTKLIVHGTGAIADEILADQTGEKMKLLAATVVTGDEDNERAASDVITTDEGIISGALYADVDSNGNIVENSIERAINTSNQAISNMATLSLMTWRQENNDMNKRLGELRASQGEHGVWARMARGQAKYGAQGIKNQYNYYQLGYDSKISDTWTLGGAFTYTDGESSYTNGSGTNKHTGFAVYGSNLRDDGSFIDIIAKYAHMKNDFDVNGGVGKGDYSTNGYSLSAEYGKRFQQDGFWIEPQAELTYGKVSSADFKTANGATVHQDSMDSLVGRLGFSLGKDLSKGNVYVRASYLYDFQGDASITMMKDGAATPFRTDIGGSWWEFGVGTNLNLGKDTHFYLDVETTAGGDVDTPWQWNAGVRFSF